jgi:translation initiation factor 2 beta subunit (eIF-2beta)/eIF-5
VFGVIFAGLTYAFVFYFRISYLVALGWGIVKSVGVYVIVLLVGVIMTLFMIIFGIVNAIKKTPAHERYFERAKRHIELDPKQSIEDYSMALKLLPAESIQTKDFFKMQSRVNKLEILNERASIFNKLDMANEAKQDWQASLFEVNKLLSSSTKSDKGKLLLKRDFIYEKLGRKDESVLDRLNYTYTEEQLLPPETTVSMGAIEGIKKGTADTKRQELVALRKELMSDGRFKAVGYCPECKTLVNLDFYLRCSVSPKHPKPTDVCFTKTP